MAKNIISALMYSAFGGGVATVCFFTNQQYNKRRASAAEVQSKSSSWDYNWDKREPSSLVKPIKSGTVEEENRYNNQIEAVKPTATRNIFLIRHGQYNTNGSTDKDRSLTELGQKQAICVGEHLKKINFPYTTLIHSTMTRAIETANIIHAQIPDTPMQSCDLLREGAPIPPDPPVTHWQPDAKQFYADGARIEAAFRKYFHRADVSQEKNSYEIIACHANVIRYFVCRILQFPREGWLRFSLHHCSITWITIRPNGRVSAQMIGGCGYLSKELLTKN